MQPPLPWEAISISYSECASVALVVHHVMRLMRRIVLSSMACPAVPYLINGTNFGRGGGGS